MIDVIGWPDCPQGHAIRDFLTINNVTYQWYNLDDCELPIEEYEINLNPIVCFDSTPEQRLYNPSLSDIAHRLGYSVNPSKAIYDVVVVGGGPAGLSATINAASEGLSTLLVDKRALGGQAATSSLIKNYLGFDQGVSGRQLADNARRQAESLGAEIVITQEVVDLDCGNKLKRLHLSNGRTVLAKALVVAVGVSYRQIDVDGLSDLYGRNVFYGASVSEAHLCANKHVAIIGGGNSAGQAAVFLAEHAATVRIVIRGDDIRKSMSEYLVQEIESRPNITISTHTELTCADGKTLYFNDVPFKGYTFIFIGAKPRTEWLPDRVLDDKGFIVTRNSDYMFMSEVEGLFAVGDVRSGSVKRVASAVGEGSVVVSQIHKFIANTWR